MDKDRQSNYVHSQDFDRMRTIMGNPEKINGKTLDEWNAEHGLNGILPALKEMGWDSWQWRWRAEDSIPEDLRALGDRGCFMEVFGHYYGGYIRTDAVTLRECGEKALNRAQKFAACEAKTGHDYGVPKGYTNGYRQCKLCGFGGYTPLFKVLNSKIENMKIHADLLKEQNVKLFQAITDAGFEVKGFLGEPNFTLEPAKDKPGVWVRAGAIAPVQ